MSLFPIPVSGQKIPSGWFGRLVRFMNSLVLRGDGAYFAVKHTQEGTLIAPTPYLIDQLAQAGRAAAGGSGGIGYLDPSTMTAQNIPDGTSLVAPSDGILYATAAISFPANTYSYGWGKVKLTKNNLFFDCIIIECSSDRTGLSAGAIVSSIMIPVAAGVTIEPLWGADSPATATCYATFYT